MGDRTTGNKIHLSINSENRKCFICQMNLLFFVTFLLLSNYQSMFENVYKWWSQTQKVITPISIFLPYIAYYIVPITLWKFFRIKNLRHHFVIVMAEISFSTVVTKFEQQNFLIPKSHALIFAKYRLIYTFFYSKWNLIFLFQRHISKLKAVFKVSIFNKINIRLEVPSYYSI